ncbi:bifunctional 2-C-methyl-D-erythritol 4-phosphate cytidylyltransferase/2-C-methyl-D-erythritol 2,4-cyclodiphosphate synthase [Sphingomonas rhizophila]|uniref:Bifunctional enzyme IspD/IspF n=1 Tax=Sphingomonas rhizophila TaxID=2071607 RepID=A0A7G9SDG2_9SPHN|nr:bifunctional 2-C-methyl-D-erythritol 4-phosphate cytidylyltransferase/2-C-methyl-D-erythritol 2,4-cyclodiphosphate synthase [Sphingomonas rhizophila]QNN65887.1 bifunctional 2-C-methyl-D-erythritol 4-phosphate cytidylyltransferase/2-C-methyl-D-erythritol 2,4-cyclodiphosphate synthase [Sphingomonas rhizophila]
MTVTALIVAAGSGSRMGGEVPKQYRALGGKSVLAHAVDALAGHPRIDSVRVVIGEGQQDEAARALTGRDVGSLLIGGAERADSVRAGLDAVTSDVILIHDAARPFCPPDVIDRLLDALADHEGAVPVLAIADTVASGVGTLDQMVDRTRLLRVQTPQAFHREDLMYAIEETRGRKYTDESSALVAAGLKVAAVEGSSMLDKLTTAEDWRRAETTLAASLITRTGMGFDVHAFAGEGPIMMGGIAIPHDRGLAGHSDADVVLHAITDALLGAAGQGDIGQHFPPSDPQWKGASSDRFLEHAASLVRKYGGLIDHVDCTVICEAPKVGPHREAIRAKVAEILGLPISSVSIKATTTERLGFTGRGEGIAAQAVATVRLPAKAG